MRITTGDDDDDMEDDDDLVMFSGCEDDEECYDVKSSLVEGSVGASLISVPVEGCPKSQSAEGYTYFKWPTTTTSNCLHCCHGILGRPVGIVLDIDIEQDDVIVYMYQRFCSWECQKKYILGGTERDRRKRRLYYMAEAKRYIFGEEYFPTHQANPTDVLQVFGGDLTIEAYRAHFFPTFPSTIPANVTLVGVGALCYSVNSEDQPGSERYMLHEESSPKTTAKGNNILETLVGIKKK